jgi:outer membrane protein assembly factor BamB
VGAGGRLFKAFGHIAFKTAQNEVLNKLYGINAYNGTILWTRPLKKGFMIHRNTMIATSGALYLADDESCKLIDPATGRTRGEIVPPVEAAEGTVWKWMALEKGVLFALLGGAETRAAVRRARVSGFGHWPWGMWQGYDYRGGAGAFGFGRNLFAIDPETKKMLWHRREEELLDSRGVCMRDGRIYCYAPRKFLACLSAKDGTEVWRTSDRELLAAIGPSGRAQHYVQGFSTSAYIKCNGEYLFFAGPQRPNLVAVSCRDGKLAWSRKGGNYQLVLRGDALYAVGHGPRGGESVRYEYGTWRSLGRFLGRRACTRATGNLDSVFYRAAGGTIRYDPASDTAEHIAPMRPPCHDGVIISDGMLYWGPWICGCQLALYGNIALAPAGRFDLKRKAREEDQLVTGRGDLRDVRELHGQPRTSGNTTTCGDMAFTVGPDGIVKAREAGTRTLVWKAYTSGGIRFPPAVWKGRLYVGSNDGRVYAFEAATGRLLWRFRAAPAERWIPVYGKLMSTWPVAGGVAVEGGRVYAAAGIAHYDGTHVYALDAVTGRIEWHNDSSGALAECGNGVSLQGRLRVAHGKLTFCGGNAYPEAAFDLKTGRCLSAPHGPRGERPTTFYAVQDYLKEIRERRGREMAKKFSGRLREIQSGRFSTVDLRAYCSRPLVQKGTGGRRPNDLRVLPVGRQTFRGVTFDIVDQARNGGSSQIRLLSSRHQKDLPREVKGIGLGGRKAARLYFFHTMEWGDESPRGAKVGEYVVRYEKRQAPVTVPIVNGANIRDWWGPEGLPGAHVGWFGHNGLSWVGVYICVWQNPHPDEAIASVDFVTHDLGPGLSLIALTGEE